MWMRCWFALIFSLILTLYCQYSHAEVTVDDVLVGHGAAGGGVSDVGVGGRQGSGTGSTSKFAKQGTCSVRCTGTSCVGELLGGAIGGAVGRGIAGPVGSIAGSAIGGAVGRAATAPPAQPPAPTEPPETFPENPSLLDVNAFLTKRCTKCHTAQAVNDKENKIRIKTDKTGETEMTFKEAMDRAKAKPAMAAITANPNVVKALETWKNLP